MTYDEVEAAFEKHHDEHCQHKRIPKADMPSRHLDLCAFILLDKRFPTSQCEHEDMVCSASHDEVYLCQNLDGENLLTEDDVVYLLRCGVTMQDGMLHLFV